MCIFLGDGGTSSTQRKPIQSQGEKHADSGQKDTPQPALCLYVKGARMLKMVVDYTALVFQMTGFEHLTFEYVNVL